MSVEARRAVVRLMLCRYRQGRQAYEAKGITHGRFGLAYARLCGPLRELELVAPNRYAFVSLYVDAAGALVELSPAALSELERTCDWLADRIGVDFADYFPFGGFPHRPPFAVAPDVRRELGLAVATTQDDAEPELEEARLEYELDDEEGDEMDSSHAVWTTEAVFEENGGKRGWGRESFTIDGHSSAAPAGRPRRGTAKPAAAIALLEDGTGMSIDELRACSRRGNQTAEQDAARAVLVPVLKRIRSEKRATSTALAGALECNESTIRRLVAK